MKILLALQKKLKKMRKMDNNTLIQNYLTSINDLASAISRNITVMEICGGHTNVIMKYGIRDILPNNIKLISGPGCPVCVSDQKDIDNILAIAQSGIPVATYGDMLKVPGTTTCLEDIKAAGADVFETYSTTEVLPLKKKYPDIVFFGVGFETTAPMTAFLLKHNIAVYSVHKWVLPAMQTLLSGEVAVDGFINPGHVSTIIGLDPYKKVAAPQVISGFTPEKLLRSISLLLTLVKNEKNTVVNGYTEIVKEKGNTVAQQLLDSVFYTCDSSWRGLGTIPASGLEVKDDTLNAKKVYSDIIAKVPQPKPTGCRCGEILKGLIEPSDCPLFNTSCTPDNPKGACMVSNEGSCAIYFKYRSIKD